jgi:hypothetical protein
MLTRGGQLIEHEEVNKMVDKDGFGHIVSDKSIPVVELLNFDDSPTLSHTDQTLPSAFHDLESLNFFFNQASVASTPSIQSVSTPPTVSPTISLATLVETKMSPRPASALEKHSLLLDLTSATVKIPFHSISLEKYTPLLDLDSEPAQTREVTELFQSRSWNELAGLDFHANMTSESEAIVFQGRHSRKSSEKIPTPNDAGLTDYSFRMFNIKKSD